MEIHSAAKLPTRHLRSAEETGARSALKSGLDLSSASCAGERSDWMGFMIGSIARTSAAIHEALKPSENQAFVDCRIESTIHTQH